MKVEDFVKEVMYQAAVFLALWRHHQRIDPLQYPIDLTPQGWIVEFVRHTQKKESAPVLRSSTLMEWPPYKRASALLHTLWSKSSQEGYVRAEEWEELKEAITALARHARDGGGE